MSRKKPSTCPDDAWWSEEDQEWVHGPRDASGLLTGTVRYWTPKGVFLSECEHEAGKPHGNARRFSPDGSVAQECRYEHGLIEGVRKIYNPERVHSSITVFECHYKDGDLIGTLYRNAEGEEVHGSNGMVVPPRPKGVPPTAGPFRNGEWLYMRRSGEDGDDVLETREYYADGRTRSERLPDGMNRRFYKDGALLSEGMRVSHKEKRPEHGVWRYGDEGGVIRRESEFEYGEEKRRTLHRTESEAGGHALQCAGPAMALDRFDALECGVWEFLGKDGDLLHRVDLGERVSDEVLLASPAAAEEASPSLLAEEAGRASAASRLATLRLLGRTGQEEHIDLAVRLDDEPWPRVNQSGEIRQLDRHGVHLVEVLNSLLFATSPALALGELAARFLRENRPQVALDLVDAGLCYGRESALEEARIGYLRTLEREEEANVALQRLDPDRIRPEQEKALLRIRSNPASDEHRLAYAALVAEQTPEHARLIRMDCGKEESEAQAAERGSLVNKLRAMLPNDIYIGDEGVERGFYPGKAVHVETSDFLSHADALFRAMPLASELDLSYASKHIPQLVVMPALERYTGISFWDTLLFQGRAAQLVSCKYLQNLEHLGLYETCLYDEDLTAVTRATTFPRLKSLDISNRREGQDYTFAGFETLRDAVYAPTLRRLAFDRRYFDYEDVVDVLACLPKLHDLSMEASELGPDAIRKLMALPREWTRLGLARCGLGPEGADALAKSPSVAKLETLIVGRNDFEDEGITSLLASEHLSELRILDLSGGDGVGAALGLRMADAPMAPHLEELEVSLGKLGEEGGVALARAPLRSLTRLNLHNNQIGDAGAIAIAKSESLGALRYLDLSGNGITDKGALALVESKSLASLEWLELGGAEMSTDVLDKLKARFQTVHETYPWNRR